MFSIKGVKSSECPVSCITPDSRQLVQVYQRARSLSEAGVESFPAKSLPIPLADAFIVISNEENRCENTRHEYEMFDAKHGA